MIKRIVLLSCLTASSCLFYQFKNIDTTPTSVNRQLPTKMEFCGERVPLEITDVRERLDRELIVNKNLHSATSLIIKRANRYFSEIEPILKKLKENMT